MRRAKNDTVARHETQPVVPNRHNICGRLGIRDGRSIVDGKPQMTAPQKCEVCNGEFPQRNGRKFFIGYQVFVCQHCMTNLVMEKLRQ